MPAARSSSLVVASDANQFLDVAIVHSATRHGTARQAGSIHDGPLADQLRAAAQSDSHVVTDSVLHNDHRRHIVTNIATVLIVRP
jgi:hypothetical protein